MNTKTSKKKYLKLSILIISLCLILGVAGACLPIGISLPDLTSENVLQNTAATITTNSGDNLGEYNDGYYYVYTDKSLIEKYRANDVNTPYDVSYQKVAKTSTNRGSQANPYVISSTDHWEAFVKRMETYKDPTTKNLTYGEGEYFVLGADLDFKNGGIAFYPVRYFYGTFYGMGHSIKNITCSNWKYWSGGTTPTDMGTSPNIGFGVFCQTVDATITDLVVDNFSYPNYPKSTATGTSETRGAHVGGVVGMSSGDDYVLNCQTSGEISTTETRDNWSLYGGIVGGKNNVKVASSPLTVYRCSSKLTTYCNSSSNSNGHMVGGIIADNANRTRPSNLYIYECATNVTANSPYRSYAASIVGDTLYPSTYIENVVGSIDITSNNNPCSGALTAVSYNSSTSTTYKSDINVKNAYVEGKIGSDNTNKKSMSLLTIASSVTVTASQLVNAHVVKSTSSVAPVYFGSPGWNNGTTTTNSAQTEHTTTADMISKAQTFFGNNYSKIWDKNKIGTDYTPDNSPVRNYLYAVVDYRHLKNGGKSEEAVGIDDGIIYQAGDKLIDESTAPTAFATYLNNKRNNNRVFVGWTDDPTGKKETITKLPEGLCGGVTLYAVWTLPTSYLSNLTVTISSSQDKIEYDGDTSIELTAKVKQNDSLSGDAYMSNPKPTYYFTKDGDVLAGDKNTASVNQSGKLELTQHNESGEYSFNYRLTDSLEPLWYYEGTCADSKDIEIEQVKLASLEIKNFKISDDTVPYYGKELKEVDFTVKVFFKGKNKEVDLAKALPYRWKSTTGHVSNDKTNTTTITIFPDDTDNFLDKYEFEVQFESKALEIEFYLQDIDETITAEVEYGAYYGPLAIIYEFQQAYMAALEEWGDASFVKDIKDKTPRLDGMAIVDGDETVKKFDTEFDPIKKKERIVVTFTVATYVITFNPNNDGETDSWTEPHGYGEFLKEPEAPTKGSELFVGWYFDDVTIGEGGKEVKVNRAWRFNPEGDLPRDRVTRKVELKAKFITADTLLSLEVKANRSVVALDKIKEGDLTVTAVYGSTEDPSIEQPVVLNWTQYGESSVTYLSSSDGLLHVIEGGFNISVKFEKFGVEKIGYATLTVNPAQISTGSLKLEDKTVILVDNDTVESIDPINTSLLPSEIIDVVYVYSKGGKEIDPSEVKGLGTFSVRAEFIMDSDDYYAVPLTATLKIVRAQALEKPTFKGGVEYDGTTKYIKDYLNGFSSDFMEIVSGTGVSGTDVGKYVAYVKLNAGTWSDGTTDNVKIEWTIDKATLIPDWDEWEFVADGSGFAPAIDGIADGLASGDSVDYASAFTYKIYDEDGNEIDASEVSEVGSYKIVASLNAGSDLFKNYKLDDLGKEWSFVVVPESGMAIYTIEWSDTEFLYDGEEHLPTYVVKDRDNNVLTNAEVNELFTFTNYEAKKDIATYTIKVTAKDSSKIFIRSGAVCKFKIVKQYGDTPPEEGASGDQTGSGDNGGIGSLGDIFKNLGNLPLWQLIASAISIILIIIFVSKTAKYNGERKKFNKKADKLESSVYAAAPFLGLAVTAWTAIACVLMGLAVLSLVMMIISKNKRNKAEEEYDEIFEEYQQKKEEKKEENLRMMFMGMGNGMGQGMPQGYAYAGQPAFGIEDMRGLISETVTAMLPGMQQLLPQQASTNDEIVQKLIEENARSQETIQELMHKLSNQSTERVVEREVAATSTVTDEAIKSLIEGQRIIMEKLANQSNQPQQPQVVEKVIEKEVPVEKIVEKIVEVPVEVEKIVEKEVVKEVPVEVEKIVEKEVKVEVPVEVEKIVEKEVIKEVPVEIEKIVEVKKEVIKEVKVEVPVLAPAKPKKEVAPKLTLDEAYEALSKEQKKYFDGLKAYALSKDKCKEKKSTYFTVFGATTTNPILKLTIKKDTTVALLKMEDEFMKDLRRDASGDGTKVKVKETEIVVSDAQAFDTAKKMIDLREDQIERYADLLKEQRSVSKRK